jgi:hypothetical protein
MHQRAILNVATVADNRALAYHTATRQHTPAYASIRQHTSAYVIYRALAYDTAATDVDTRAKL